MSIIGARIVLDLPEKLKNELEKEAKERMVSRAALIRMIFKDWLSQKGGKKRGRKVKE